MNKKGFTLVELITTFSVSAVIIVMLINIVLIIKDMNMDSKIKTELMINQGQLSEALNSKITDNNLVSYSKCSDSEFCYNFMFSDGNSINLSVTESSIKFGNYVYDLPEGSEVLAPSIEKKYIEVTDENVNNSFLVITIPISNKLYPDKNFGTKVVYQYNSNILSL